jgi:hypothetical protein
MTSLFEQICQVSRESSVEVLRRSAVQRRVLLTICGFCKAFMSERPAAGNGKLEESICKDCFPTTNERVN